MEKKVVFTAEFISALLLLLVFGAMFVDSTEANIIPPVILPTITIGSDGKISPQTELISRNGNTYTLTADIQEYPIIIACSNILFDGAGHTINVTSGDNVGLELRNVSNVTVKNIKVFSRNIYTIYLHGSSRCLITGVQAYNTRIYGSFNNITKSNTGILIFSGSNNLFTRNNIRDVLVGDGSSNIFFKNNFHLTDYPSLRAESIWDNGSVGNYWSNYTTKYPKASEVNNTGVGDTPYMIERDWHSTKEYPNVKNVDNYPLIYPYDIENDTIAFRTPLLIALVVSASEASAAIVGMGLLVYFKKRKR